MPSHCVTNRRVLLTISSDNNIDLIATTETWFSESDDAVKVECTPANYKILDCPRLKRRGGGIAIKHRSEIQVTEVISGSKPTFEFASITPT